jgi:hypothetical protein
VSAAANAEWPRLTNEARESEATLPEEGNPTEDRRESADPGTRWRRRVKSNFRYRFENFKTTTLGEELEE